MHIFITAFFMALATTSFAADPAPERVIVAEVIKSYGGIKALEGIRTVYAQGQITAFMQEDEGTSRRYFQRPRKLRAELTYKKSSETRIINGSRGWRRSNNKPAAEVIGPPFLGMAYQYKYLDLPFGFLDNGYQITLLSREKLNGDDVDVLQLSDPEGPPMRVYINVKTRLIAKVVGVFSLGTVGTELASEFSDYRLVDGIQFPFTIINYGGERRIAETHISDIRLNAEMRDDLFQP